MVLVLVADGFDIGMYGAVARTVGAGSAFDIINGIDGNGYGSEA